MKKICFVIVIFVCLIMTSCGSKSSSIKQSTVFELNKDEKIVYDSIVGSIASFKNPSSVTLIVAYEKSFIGRYIKISAQNGFGGTSTAIYRITGSSLVDANDVDVSTKSIDYNISVSKINTALKEYKQDNGWV